MRGMGLGMQQRAMMKGSAYDDDGLYRKKAAQVVDAIKTRIEERAAFITEQEPLLRKRLQETGLDYTFDQVVELMQGQYFVEKLQKMQQDDQVACLKVLTLQATRGEIEGLTRIATHLVNPDIKDDGERIINLGEGEIIRYFERFDPNSINAANAINMPDRQYGMTEALGGAAERGMPGKLF